jgi:hypothetical protein
MPIPHLPSGPRRGSGKQSSRTFLGRRSLLLGAAALVPIGALTLWDRHAVAGVKATLYKNPQCTCCEQYAAYLGQHGFDVTIIPSNDLATINRQHGVPEALDGCHTTLMSGYVAVGHIPVDIVQRMLTQKPDITGISIPGMPSGTPGMGGPKSGPIQVYAFGKGEPSVFATF